MIFLFFVFLCWGSFLNVLAYRLVRGEGITGRSRCPACGKTIAWYDLIPVVSWLLLNRKCRSCKAPISWLYPAIELATVSLLTILYSVSSPEYFYTYFILFSALIVTIRSDLESMLISRFVSLALIPIGLLASACGFLPITLFQSLLGALIGYACLAIPAFLFRMFTGKEGLGQGDIDLMTMIGSFTGALGVWFTILIGSTLGSIIGIIYLYVMHKERSYKIPFGPFLAIGAMAYVLWQGYLQALLGF